MIKVVKAKYLSTCDSCGSKCTHLIRAGRRYLHVCTVCLLNLISQFEKTEEECKHESKEQVEQ